MPSYSKVFAKVSVNMRYIQAAVCKWKSISMKAGAPVVVVSYVRCKLRRTKDIARSSFHSNAIGY